MTEQAAVLIKCSDCKEMKGLDEFHVANDPWNVRNRHRRTTVCKQCGRVRGSAYGKTPEGKLSTRNRFLKKKYGINHAIYEQMLAAQGGKCAICPAIEPGAGKKHFCIDHDHATGKIRGLLCDKCNIAISFLSDCRNTMLSAMKYITKHIAPEMIE